MKKIVLEKGTRGYIHVPQRYIPRTLSQKDRSIQKRNLLKTRKLYKKGKYVERPPLKSFISKKSPHIANAEKLYNVKNVLPTNELARKTKCKRSALEKIVNKGRGAYFSSGSRPNQTAESWGLARLASSITAGNSAIIDYHILHEGCKPDSIALKMATKKCKEENKCQKYLQNKR
jgi:hypothetical protein